MFICLFICLHDLALEKKGKTSVPSTVPKTWRGPGSSGANTTLMVLLMSTCEFLAQLQEKCQIRRFITPLHSAHGVLVSPYGLGGRDHISGNPQSIFCTCTMCMCALCMTLLCVLCVCIVCELYTTHIVARCVGKLCHSNASQRMLLTMLIFTSLPFTLLATGPGLHSCWLSTARELIHDCS